MASTVTGTKATKSQSGIIATPNHRIGWLDTRANTPWKDIVIRRVAIAIGIYDFHVLVTKLIISAAIDTVILVAKITKRHVNIINHVGKRIIHVVWDCVDDSLGWREDRVVRHTTSWHLTSSAIIRISDEVVQVEHILEACITNILTSRTSGVLRTNSAEAIEL